MFLIFQVSQWYDLVVFTASMEIYGAAVADKLDNSRGILRKRYYRQVCIKHEICASPCVTFVFFPFKFKCFVVVIKF